ncbi:hypothetical protein PXK01_19585 [Phaeobacter sp. PT47_59]|uniref:hypothetical protein n=1 Tax=Phaeobacter sp. PT47_59 TaxID=3029979 RepID=UPI002380C178|nr:hypothetical protein [Phaeobacter sp. PT47_59]MDE4176364.1 hypothetical protein [Phaeobacter sp. PT47_59]
MKLRPPGPNYDRLQEADRIRQIEQADRQNHKRGQDVEIGQGRLILTSPNGTRYSVEVDNAGALSTSAV